MLHSQHFLFVTLSEFVGAATVQKSILPLRVPITQRKYLLRNYTTNHTTPADRFTTGTIVLVTS
jgi:hypothetical protein